MPCDNFQLQARRFEKTLHQDSESEISSTNQMDPLSLIKYFNYDKTDYGYSKMLQLVSQIARYNCWESLKVIEGNERRLAEIIVKYCINADILDTWIKYTNNTPEYKEGDFYTKVGIAKDYFQTKYPKGEVSNITALVTFNQVVLHWDEPTDIKLDKVIISSELGSGTYLKCNNNAYYERNKSGFINFLIRTVDVNGIISKGKRYSLFLNDLSHLRKH